MRGTNGIRSRCGREMVRKDQRSKFQAKRDSTVSPKRRKDSRVGNRREKKGGDLTRQGKIK